jgi:hypothetical protein
MKLKWRWFLSICFVVNTFTGCISPPVSHAPAWQLNTAEWKSYNFSGIHVDVPNQFPLQVIGNGTWYFLMKWDRTPSEEIVFSFDLHKDFADETDLEKYKDRLIKGNTIIMDSPIVNSIKFAAPAGYSNKDGAFKLNANSQVSMSEYGFGILLDHKHICNVIIIKDHEPVSYSEWKYEEIFSPDECRLVDEIAKTIKLSQ